MFVTLALFAAFVQVMNTRVVGAASLVPSIATNFNPHTLFPPDASAGKIVFNWHDSEDTGDHNAIDTVIYQLTDGGNSSLADNSTGQYAIEGIAVHFNETHFKLEASTTPWIAVFACAASEGNSSELISNAQRLGAHAILAYSTESGSYTFCNLTENTPAVTIPIYTTENWHDGSLVFADEVDGLFAPSKIRFYDPTAMTRLAGNLTADFAALRTNVSALAQTDVVLARIPVIASNVSAAMAQAAAATTTAAGAGPTKTHAPSGALRVGMESGSRVGGLACLVLALGLVWVV
ncbi:hypothetical protein C8R46DRAFT_520689 [Mycena filopes]|nr:hypothetical protein C8R46DRAFT_520689 [Mycena filopes]